MFLFNKLTLFSIFYICSFFLIRLSFSRSTDSDLGVLWNFESSKTGDDFWTVWAAHAVTPNAHDEICCRPPFLSKNAFFLDKFGKKAISVVNADDEKIPRFEGNRVMKVTVFNDRLTQIEWCESFHGVGDSSCQNYGTQTKARVDPRVNKNIIHPEYDEQIWYGFAVYVPEDFVFEDDSDTCEGISEIQGMTSGGGSFGISICGSEFRVSASYSETEGTSVKDQKRRNIIRGFWHKFVVRVRYGVNDNGIAVVWLDGERVMNNVNQNLGRAWEATGGHMVDVGTLYKHSWWKNPSVTSITPQMQFTRTLYFDAIRVSKINQGSFEMVEPLETDSEPRCDGKTNEENACFYNDGHGACVGNNVCACTADWQGLSCQYPICDNPKCTINELCVDIDTCDCLPGWTPPDCIIPICSPTCDLPNSECTAPNICNCIDGWTGINCDKNEGACSPVCNENQQCSTSNECICKNGYDGEDCLDIICDPICGINKNCSSPNSCTCLSGWVGSDCDIRDCKGNFAGIDCKKCLYGWGDDDCQTKLDAGNWVWVIPTSISFVVILLVILMVLCTVTFVWIKVKKRPKALSNVDVTSEMDTLVKSEVESVNSQIESPKSDDI